MITRDNYEEWFMLYADNELSATAMKSVEEFVENHPDLKEEWDLLFLCRISPDTNLVFPDIDHLRKASEVLPNYESLLLSYIDGELNEQDRKVIESFILHRPSAQRDLSVLRQTQSQPDPALYFPDKETLYRKERDRRIVFLPWVRIAAAAVFLGVMGVMGYFFFPTRQPGNAITQNEGKSDSPYRRSGGPAGAAGSGGQTNPSYAGAVPTNASSPGNRQAVAASTGRHAAAPANTTAPAVIGGSSLSGQITAATSRKAGINKKEVRAVTSVTTGTLYPSERKELLPQPDKTELVARTGDSRMTTGEGSLPEKEGKESDKLLAKATDIPKEQSSFATQALLLNDPDNEAEKNSPVIADPASGKGKLRGIFRKVSRALGSTADRTDDGQRQILIGAFQVALK